MLQLRQLHLEFAFPGPRALGENVQDERSAVEHFAFEDALQIATLGGRQFIVKNDRIDVFASTEFRELIGFAAADEGAGHRRFKFLDAVADDLAAGGGGKFLEFIERILQVPGRTGFEFQTDEENPFGFFGRNSDERFQLLVSDSRTISHFTK